MVIRLVVEEDYISFQDGEGNIYFEYLRRNLGYPIDLGDGPMSDFIFHLCFRKWVTREMLLELISIIKTEVPDNKFDWDCTMDYINIFV